jgi:spore coat protein H
MNYRLLLNKKWLYLVFLFLFISNNIQAQSRFNNPNLEKIFDLTQLPKITLTVSEADWNKLLEAYDKAPEDNFWIESNFLFEESNVIPGNTLNRVDIRVRGNSSLKRPEGVKGELHNPNNPAWNQASFALRFDKNDPNQTFEGLTRLDLKFIREDPTRVREVYSFNLLQQEGITSGALISYCRFYIKVGTGVPGYFGIYKMKEFIEDDYLAARKTYFGDFPVAGTLKAFLWKGDNGASLNNPADASNGAIYDLRTSTTSTEKQTAIKQLEDFITYLNRYEGEELKSWAKNAIDIPILFKTYLINILCGNMDDYWNNSNNYNFYFNTYGKFYFIPNDFDTSLGTGFSIDAGRQDIFNWGKPENPLIQKLLTIEEYRTLYKAIFSDLTKSSAPFSRDNSIDRIQLWQSLISPYIQDETIHGGCLNDDNTVNDNAGCVYPPALQTPILEDNVGWWVGEPNKDYKLLALTTNNFFTVSGNPNRVNNTNTSKRVQPNSNLIASGDLNETELEIIGNSVQISPNPVYDKFTIYITGEAQTRVTNLNVTGVNNTFTNLITVEPKKNNYEVDLSKLSSGVYVVQITLNTGQTISKKVIKN